MERIKLLVGNNNAGYLENIKEVLKSSGYELEIEYEPHILTKDSAVYASGSRYNKIMNELSLHGIKDFNRTIKKYLEECVKASGITGCGLWFIDRDGTYLMCKDYFDTDTGEHSGNEKIKISEAGNYLGVIEIHRLIRSSNIWKDLTLNDFLKNYFRKRGTQSIFDLALRRYGKLIGLLRCEVKKESRIWDIEDEYFFNFIADLILISLEISERKIKEESSKKSSELFKNLFDSLSEGMIVTDSNDTFILTNPSAEEMFGSPPEGLLGRNLRDFIEPDQLKIILHYNEERKKGKKSFYEIEIKKFGGEKRIFSISANPRYDKTGNYSGAFCLLIDITDRKKSDEETIYAKEKAEELNRLKSNFLSNISHEIRTPLNSILGLSNYLMHDQFDKDTIEFASIINASGNKLLETLNQIIDLSRIESGNLEVSRETFNLNEILLGVQNIYLPSAAEKKLKFEVRIGKPIEIFTDKKMLKSIMNNMVSNAIKYTNSGGVTIEAEKIIIENSEWSQITVKDTGIGIPDNQKKQIFESFRQLSEGWGRKFEGLGLGLTIARKYLKILGGYIDFNSEEGSGTTFKLFIPHTIVESDDMSQYTSELTSIYPHSMDYKLLYVEDDYNCQLLVKIILKDLFNIDIAKNLNDALSLIGINQYDLILLDINLGSGETGLDLLKILRNNIKYENTPVIAVTAYALKNEREAILNAGCIDHISKPFEKDILINTITNAISRS
ncbi:MAG: PAS domain S-box protein [Ignavibacteria bacterium]|nr:PAS domain S-box protein [Ignavibacteria bacterium]